MSIKQNHGVDFINTHDIVATMHILGIETSCDDTSVSVVSADRTILSNKVVSKLEEHQLFGGVVPEIASRNHLATLPCMLSDLDVDLNTIDAIAVTQGPGLIGGLIVGVMVAKALSYALSKPIIPINHLEGHLLTNRLVHKDLPYPFLSLLVSGGHCQFIIAKNYGDYEIIGHTLDDAVGEAFDKVAKMMDLKYPGGPKIEQLAKHGDPYKYQFPMPLIKNKDCNLSFSGLKTAVKRKIDSIRLENNELTDKNKADIAASFQYTVGEILGLKLEHAILIAQNKGIKHFAVCGGVSANQYICQILKAKCIAHNFAFYNAPLALCVDNAAMIAWSAIEQLICNKDKKNSWQSLTFAPQSTLNLE